MHTVHHTADHGCSSICNNCVYILSSCPTNPIRIIEMTALLLPGFQVFAVFVSASTLVPHFHPKLPKNHFPN